MDINNILLVALVLLIALSLMDNDGGGGHRARIPVRVLK